MCTNQTDAMVSPCENSVFVETSVDKEQPSYALVTPLVEKQLKTCSIKFTQIDEVLSYVPKQNLCDTLMHAGRPHTRSACTPNPPSARTGCGRSRYASSVSENYKDPDTMSDEDSARMNPKPNTRSSVKPKVPGPTDERIHSQNNKTVHPTQRLLPVKSDTPETSSSDVHNSDVDTETYDPDPQEEETDAPKGAFKITVCGLKKAKKYHCKHCEKSYDSSKKLMEHHQKCHKIMYCKLCNHAFNNPMTYSRHLESHSSKGKICDKCGKAFAFKSQLDTHQSVHSETRHKCMHSSCGRDFKNIGDLTRHLKLHQCPDCNYSNADMRNFESHRLKHSRIAKYKCNICDKEFIYNTQYQRHLADQNCKPKCSASPEF